MTARDQGQPSERSPDVLVVGGGPAGLTAAIACAIRGLSAVVIERRHQHPIDKACGEGLMPDAVEVLRELGVAPRGCLLQGISYSDAQHSVSGRFDRERLGPGLGVRRTELSKALSERARQLGVVLQTGDAFVRLTVDAESRGVLSTSGEWRPRVIVGADGARSKVRQECGLGYRLRRRRRNHRMGVRAHFECPDTRLDSSGTRDAGLRGSGARDVEVFWADGVEAYLTPITDRSFGLAFLFSPDQEAEASASEGDSERAPESGSGTRFERLLGQFPKLEDRVAAARPTGGVRGAGPLRQRSRGLARGNVALVGDAGGYVDAITGEGLAIAFAEAQLLASQLAPAAPKKSDASLSSGQVSVALKRYERLAVRRRRLPDLLTEGALLLSRRPWLRRRFLAALERRPELFDSVLTLHARGLRDSAAIPMALRLGWQMAIAPIGRW